MLGPEMRSTGEVMGLSHELGIAFAKSQVAAGQVLPTKGTVFLSVKDADKQAAIPVARKFHRLGFELMATTGHPCRPHRGGVPAAMVCKVSEGPRPHVVDRLINRRWRW